MAGNSRRRGATRNPGSKKGAQVGSGGRGRKALEGKGPTPKAEDRPYHVAHKRKVARERAAARRPAPRGGRKVTGEVLGGRNSVLEALRAGVPCTTVWVAHRIESDDRVREVLAIAGDRGIPLLEVTKPELDRLTDGVVHQGLAAQVPAYDYVGVDDLLRLAEDAAEPPFVVALDGVTDPRNLGAVIRSAGAFGAHGVLLTERRSAGVTAAAWKVSAGAAARVPVAQEKNLVRALTTLQEAGCFVVGLDAGGDTAVADLELAAGPVVVVVGSEGKGLGRLVRETCDVVASIPIAREVESLNAGVAAGIGLYEVARIRSRG